MIDAELSTLESLAKAATPGPWEHLPHNNKDAWVITKYQNPESEEYVCSIAFAFGDIQEKRNKDAAYIAAANPAAILELIAELWQARKERDWLVDHIIKYGDTCPSEEVWEKCTAEEAETHLCTACWLNAAKEATCTKN